MPIIPQYDAPAGLVPHPSDMAVSTAREVGAVGNRLIREEGEAVGGAIRKVGSDIGEQVDQHIASQAISHGSAAWATLYSGLVQDWNDQASKADVNDSSVADRWREGTLEPQLAKFQDAFASAPPRAQEYAMHLADETRAHFLRVTTADSATRAGMAVNANVQQFTTALSNAAMSDPSVLDHVKDIVPTSIAAMVDGKPNLSADDAARIKTEVSPRVVREIARATGYGLAVRDPQYLIDAVNSGKFDEYMSPEEKDSAIRRAQEAQQKQVVVENHERTLRMQDIHDRNEDAMNGYLGRLGNGEHISDKEIFLDKNLTAEGKENVFGFIHRRTNEMREESENAQHPQAFRALSNQMIDDNGRGYEFDAKPIFDAYRKDQISYGELQKLLVRGKTFDQPMMETFNSQVREAERAIRRSVMLFREDDKAAAVNRMESDAHTMLETYRQAHQDVRPLLDPTSDKYIFTPAWINSYMKPSRLTLNAQGGATATAGGAQGSATPASMLEDARQAIARGADPAKVAAKYKSLTGLDLQ